MNRQTMAVTFGTVALLIVGFVLLYLTPTPAPNPPASQPVAGKAKSKFKAKLGKSPGKLPPGRLIHKREIPADRAAAPSGAPNVVVVIASTQRRDQWTVYDGPPDTTPFIAEQVSAHGVRMDDVLAVGADPHPTSAAITTGRLPHNVGAVEPSERRNLRPTAQEAELLAERLATAGWFTMGVTANHHLNRRMGQAQGFDWYRDSQPFSLSQERRIPAAQVVNFALKRVQTRTDAEKARPLYLRLAFTDSHKPFTVPPAEFKPFEGEDHSIAPYRATVRRMDEAVQTLVKGLSAAGITHENTLFVVVADHGEGLDMPKHHRKQHGFVLYRSTVQIPWVMWGKGLTGGGKVAGLASQVDVAPTVLALAGLTDQSGFDGIDHSAAVRGKAKATTRTEAYADTLFGGAHRASLWTSTRQCQKDFGSTHQLEDDDFADACYDRTADPDFSSPVEDAAMMARLVSQHDELMAKVKPPAADVGAEIQ
ncbi:MAG: sulfatase-like hydrolase/transferase [Myxococcales bacterium]|nr:sulfatase-like hydrolase/transferase [Myxococcales bacterium]